MHLSVAQLEGMLQMAKEAVAAEEQAKLQWEAECALEAQEEWLHPDDLNGTSTEV